MSSIFGIRVIRLRKYDGGFYAYNSARFRFPEPISVIIINRKIYNSVQERGN